MTFATFPRRSLGDPKPEATLANAVAVGASWVDLDYYRDPAWAEVHPVLVVEAVRNLCEDRGWPSPSYATHSGRGVLCVWLYDSVPAQAVAERHRALQQTLHETFRFLGSDPSAKPMNKFFRMPRTYNEKSGRAVAIIWPAAVREVTRTTFDALAAAVLPWRRKTKRERDAEAVAQRAARAERLAGRRRREGHAGAVLGGSSYWRTMDEDLARLFRLRHGDGPVPDGKGRNFWIVAFAYVAAWRMPASDLAGYVEEVAARCGLSCNEALAKTSSIRAKATSAARGERSFYKGRAIDPRYRPAPAHFVSDDLLDIKTREMKAADLRILVDDARRRANAAGRVEKSRRAAGVMARDEQQRIRREVGACAIEIRATCGMTVVEVAQFFGTSKRWMDNALRDAKTATSVAMALPASPKAALPPAAPEPVGAAPGPSILATVADVADTLDHHMTADPSTAHEVLRGTRQAPEPSAGTLGVFALPPYNGPVTVDGWIPPSRQTPVADRKVRRASPCLAV